MDDAALNAAVALARDLMEGVGADRPAEFTGIGIVIYRGEVDFPAVSLGKLHSDRPKVPVRGVPEVIDTLTKLSARNCMWHDGFHLVKAGTPAALTHLSQFLSPSLDALLKKEPQDLPQGARQLTAMLVSNYPSVLCTAILMGDIRLNIYQQGRVLTSAVLKRA